MDAWIIYPDLLLLKKDNLEFKIQDKVMQVLVVLFEANGEVVGKDEFYKKVWVDSIVTENSLSKAISELRKILNSSQDKNEYIETIPRKGYRIVKLVSKEKVFKKTLALNKKRKNLKIILLLLGVFTVSYITVNYFSKNGEKLGLALSPDGSKITYYIKVENDYSLFIEDINLKEIRLITSDLKPETFVVNWSPNGDKLVYNATKKNDPFYSINAVSLKNQTTTYIKFAKNEENHETESTPKELDSLVFTVKHKEIKSGPNKIHYIYLTNKDTIKVFFQDKLIKSFSW